MLLSGFSTLALIAAATQLASALPVEEPTIEKNATGPTGPTGPTTCKPIAGSTGFLTGSNADGTFRFTYNSAHEVAYVSTWKTSKQQLQVEFQSCYDVEHDDGSIYVGRLYVPSLKGCVSNPPYATTIDTEYYPVVTACEESTSKVGETEEWKFYPLDEGDGNYVYWSVDAKRPRPGCAGGYGYKLNGKSDNLPYQRPDHHSAIDFKCDSGIINRFSVTPA